MDNLISLFVWFLCGGFAYHYYYIGTGTADSLVESGVIPNKKCVFALCLFFGAAVLGYQLFFELRRNFSSKHLIELYITNFNQPTEMDRQVIKYYHDVTELFKKSQTQRIDAELLKDNFVYFGKGKKKMEQRVLNIKVKDYYRFLEKFYPDMLEKTDYKKYT